MRRVLALAFCLILPSVAPAMAQDRTETLADIRQELSVLYVEMQRLRRELSTTGAPLGVVQGGSTQSRLDAIETELRRLTRSTEDLELRLNRIVTDGTTRIGDLEFRLCELEAGCDIGALGETSTLGGGTQMATTQVQTQTTGPQMATAEQSDFDRAMAAYNSGDYAGASTQFLAFTDTYPGGTLSAEAHYWRGEAEAAQGAWTLAARAYLDSFSGAPDAPRAPQSLTRLGTSLHELGQSEEACLTLSEVEARYPGAPAVLEARAAMIRIGCN